MDPIRLHLWYIIVIDGMKNREARERRGETVSEGTKYSVTWVAAPVVWEVWIEVQW